MGQACTPAKIQAARETVDAHRITPLMSERRDKTRQALEVTLQPAAPERDAD